MTTTTTTANALKFNTNNWETIPGAAAVAELGADHCAALIRNWLLSMEKFVRSRPGLDPRDYGAARWYRQDARRASEFRAPALDRINTLYSRLPYTDHAALLYTIISAHRDQFSGRLVLDIDTDRQQAVKLQYITGQYYPTEYRAAAHAVLSKIVGY